MPQGAFYLFPDFTPLAERLAARGITDSGSLCERLLEETGVAILPGLVFERPRNELTTRLSYVNFDGSKALAASETIPLDQNLPKEFIHSWCQSTISAVENIVDWVSQDS